MKQININLSKDDEANLEAILASGRVHNRSEAVRAALRLAARHFAGGAKTDFRRFVGVFGGLPDNRAARFWSHDELWGSQ